MKKIIVTGGAGYIGSHICKSLARRGWEPVVVDNLSTGFRELVKWGELVELDVRNTPKLVELFRRTKAESVIHLAASAYVGESMRDPLGYYDNNVGGMCSLLQACEAANIKRVVFSSSCATYGIPPSCPISEEMPTAPVNPYGETKLICERLLAWCRQTSNVSWIALRYFNAAGADSEGEIGELHNPETHLIPLALRSISGRKEHELNLFGTDYPTRDGTAIRDYIHVMDLADAHVKAIEYLDGHSVALPINLGSGIGHSIFEVFSSIAAIVGKSVNYKLAGRREGDPPELYAIATRAAEILSWAPEYSTLESIIRSAWHWHQKVARLS